MAALVSVYREGTRELLFSRMFPDTVELSEANRLIGDYLEQEGFPELFGLERRTRIAPYEDFVILDGKVLYGRSPNDSLVHVAKNDSEAYCGAPICDVFMSDIRYKEACVDCRSATHI